MVWFEVMRRRRFGGILLVFFDKVAKAIASLTTSKCSQFLLAIFTFEKSLTKLWGNCTK